MKRQRSPSLVAALIVGLSLGGAIGCTDSATKKLEMTANTAQAAAATTYNDAVARQVAADAACAKVISSSPSVPRPTTPDAKDAACTLVGSPLPFKSTSLQKAAAPVNSTYDVIRQVETARLAVKNKTAAQSALDAVIGQLGGLMLELVADLSGAGVPLPQAVTDWTTAYKGARP